jgi:magnesium-transporting ATPase (P-type)
MKVTARQVCRFAAASGITGAIVVFLYLVYLYGWQVASGAYGLGVGSLFTLQESFSSTTWWVISAAIYCILIVCMYNGSRYASLYHRTDKEEIYVLIGTIALLLYAAMVFAMLVAWFEPMASPNFGKYLLSVIPSGILALFFVVYDMIPSTKMCANVGNENR